MTICQWSVLCSVAVAALVGLPSSAQAQCTGSGLAISCPAGTTPAQVNSKINDAGTSDGAVFTFAAGSYTWGGGTAIAPPLTKGIELICESVGACDVSYSGGFPGTWRVWSVSGGTTTKFYRVSGFDFTPAAASTIWLAVDDIDNTAKLYVTNIRLDHNTWALDSNDQIINGSASDTWTYWGVIDHNTITTSAVNGSFVFELSSGREDTDPPLNRLGTSQNLFLEDNLFTDTAGGTDCTDWWGTATSFVIRFNTSTNCRYAGHGVNHGFGPSNVEVYGNDITWNAASVAYSSDHPSCYRAIHHQGSGTIAVWGNQFTCADPINASAIAVQHYRSFDSDGSSNDCVGTHMFDENRSPEATYRGYACKHQPGRDYDFLLYPFFAFLNVNSGNKVNLVLNGGGGTFDWTTTHMVVDRDFYNAVSATTNTCAGPGQTNCSPFTGATGIGHGPLSGRPDACTVGPDSGVGEPDEGRSGVMYWATDQGSWNQSTSNPYGVQQNGADGVLYMCTATNTWSVYYTPYTYPHPLQSGGLAPAPGSPSAAVNCALFTDVIVVNSQAVLTAGASITLVGCNFGGATGTVELCNASTYAASTTCVGQTEGAWTSTSVAIGSVSLGGLTTMGYWYVQASTGPRNIVGLPVILP